MTTQGDRCPIHDTVLVRHFKIEGKWFLPTDEFYCSACVDEPRRGRDVK